MANEPSENVGSRLMFENDRVRVWDFALAPGESLPRHIHHNDYLYIVVEGGRLWIDDPEGSREVELPSDLVRFREVGDGKVDETHTNAGDAPYRNFVIELLRKD